MGEQKEHTGTDPHRQCLGGSPAPNWVSIFTLRPDLDPPGYNEVFLLMIEKKKIAEERAREEAVVKLQKKKKLGRNQKI